MQPHPMTSVMQLSITAASLCVAASAVIFAVKSMSEERNARLVEVGVGVLRVDPTKNSQVAGARKWALDLIDANAGGVKFSLEARTELLQKQLDYSTPIDYGGRGYDPGSYGDTPSYIKPNILK
jgi:hypothetical protein